MNATIGIKESRDLTEPVKKRSSRLSIVVAGVLFCFGLILLKTNQPED